VPLLVRLVPLADVADARDAAESWHDRRAAWLAELERGESSFDADPAAPGLVVRIYQTGTGPICALDLRTGMIDPSFNVDSLRAMILAGLPLPPELSTAAPPAPTT
jgi:hypothetical protein